jgi:hypothetical protein
MRFDAPTASPAVIANCLTRPISMALDEKSGLVYVTEFAGSVVAIHISP